jgi:hypothetical protein
VLAVITFSPAPLLAIDKVSNLLPETLKESTGNLYWLITEDEEIPPSSSASIYRTSKAGSPGTERRLFHEFSGVTDINYYGFTYANVGAWYGYFKACYQLRDKPVRCEMKRIPLEGGSAVVLGPIPATSSPALENDGSFLYWADNAGVRRMPIGGGAVTTVAAVAGTPLVSSLGLSATEVFFAQGTTLHRVPKAGGSLTTFATGTALGNVLVQAGSGLTTVYWTEANARVRSRVVGSAVVSTVSPGAPG